MHQARCARRVFVLSDTIPNAFFGAKQSPILRNISVRKEIASPPKYRNGGSRKIVGIGIATTSMNKM
jgi:hypothetical protein